MTNGFGLALQKREGATVQFDTGSPVSGHEPSKTRWIELRYDPEDKVDDAALKELCTLMDSYVFTSTRLLEEDSVDNLITAFASKYINPDKDY